MKSMTGFGRGASSKEDFSVTVEIKTVNNRFLDINLRIPAEFQSLENPIKRQITNRLRRGRVDVFLSVELASQSSLEINRELISSYLDAFKVIREEFNITGEPDINMIARLPNVFSTKRADVAEGLALAVEEAVAKALDDLEEMRQTEGGHLRSDIEKRLDTIENSVGLIEKDAARVTDEHRERLTKKISDAIGSVGELDPGRLAQEVAYLADRSDISEETSRLRAHIIQYRKIISEDDELGKRLDFLTQELNREANTITSKTTNLTVKGLALDVKSEIEKIREQIQNVE
jgi:uncharacterized protein (TIGR00255 family)